LKEVQRMSLNGEIVERQSFIMINSKRIDNCEKDLLKRCMELSNKFERKDFEYTTDELKKYICKDRKYIYEDI